MDEIDAVIPTSINPLEKELRTEADKKQRRIRGRIRYGKETGIFINDERFPLDWANCGTRTNYKAHLRRGQEPCEACRRAESEPLYNAGTRKWKRFRAASLIALALFCPCYEQSPKATADPCQNDSTVAWYDPCNSSFPPWRDPNWSFTPKQGQWGPNGYVPCTGKASGC